MMARKCAGQIAAERATHCAGSSDRELETCQLTAHSIFVVRETRSGRIWPAARRLVATFAYTRTHSACFLNNCNRLHSRNGTLDGLLHSTRRRAHHAPITEKLLPRLYRPSPTPAFLPNPRAGPRRYSCAPARSRAWCAAPDQGSRLARHPFQSHLGCWPKIRDNLRAPSLFSCLLPPRCSGSPIAPQVLFPSLRPNPCPQETSLHAAVPPADPFHTSQMIPSFRGAANGGPAQMRLCVPATLPAAPDTPCKHRRRRPPPMRRAGKMPRPRSIAAPRIKPVPYRSGAAPDPTTRRLPVDPCARATRFLSAADGSGQSVPRILRSPRAYPRVLSSSVSGIRDITAGPDKR